MTPLSVAIGRYRHTEALFAHPDLRIEPFPVISRAFAPMVREQRFDVSEMAIATFLMAREACSDLVLLPIVLAARFQNGALLCRADDAFGPDAMAGKRIGVRAYSQTTGLWLRGILHEEYGLRPDQVRWITFEGAHVPSYRDPPWVERAAPGADMLAMLRAGDLDGAIFGNDLPQDADLTTVFPDPARAGEAFRGRHGIMPINHLVVIRSEIARRPGVARILMDQFLAAGNPFASGCKALEPAISLAVRYALAQGLLEGSLSPEQVWAGLPAECRVPQSVGPV